MKPVLVDIEVERWWSPGMTRAVGAILISGFVMLIVGAATAPTGAYSGSIEDRLAIINTSEPQWILSKVFDGLAVAYASVGLVWLAVANERKVPGRLNVAGGVCSGVAGVVGLIYIYLLATDPGPLYDRDTPAPVVVVLIALLAIGLASFGFHFLRNRFSRWIALVDTIVGGGVLVVSGHPADRSDDAAALAESKTQEQCRSLSWVRRGPGLLRRIMQRAAPTTT